MANIYFNTGWTDIGETDYYYENTWTWVAPGQTVYLVLPLSGITSAGGGGGAGHAITAAELVHVSSLGFNIGSNLGEGNYFGDHLDGTANPVPEPATMLLLGSGLIGFAMFRRKFRK
jgi:hypothetical protein